MTTLLAGTEAYASPVYEVSGERGWATLRNSPRSYVIGNVRTGQDMVVTRRSRTSQWFAGEISGTCGWVAAMNLRRTNINGASRCGREYAPSYFASAVNCVGCEKGYRVTIRDTPACSDYNMYANVSPWLSVTRPRDIVATFKPGQQVYWRYITRDGRFVLVQDKRRASGQADWVFIRRGCLSPSIDGYPVT